MRSVASVLAVMACCFSVHADDELEEAYFGIEFKDSRDRAVIQIAWVDSENRTAQKLNVDDVVLKAGDLPVATAAELTTALLAMPPGGIVRFEVLGLRDRKPREVSVRSERLRDVVPKWFEKQRDRDAQQVLYVPKLAAMKMHIAVVEDFDGRLKGLRLRYYPKDATATPDWSLVIADQPTVTERAVPVVIACRPGEFHYDGVSDEDLPKISALGGRHLAAVREQAYIEFQTDRTTEISTLLEADRGARRYATYCNWPALVVGARELTDNEHRNLNSARLLYRTLASELKR